MRLIESEKDAIVDVIRQFDPAAEIFLYGSRIDDNQRGGDTDILILSDAIGKRDMDLIEREIFRQIDEQKIDFLLSPKNTKSSFVKMIIEKGVVALCPKTS